MLLLDAFKGALGPFTDQSVEESLHLATTTLPTTGWRINNNNNNNNNNNKIIIYNNQKNTEKHMF